MSRVIYTRNDVVEFGFKKLEDTKQFVKGKLNQHSGRNRWLLFRKKMSAFGNLVPRWYRISLCKGRYDAGFGVNKTGEAVLTFFLQQFNVTEKDQAKIKHSDENDAEVVKKLGTTIIEDKYGNLFRCAIVDENPYQTPMMIYPAVHYYGWSLGWLWFNDNNSWMFRNQANFSDHEQTDLVLHWMQGRFSRRLFCFIPYTIGNYLASRYHVPEKENPNRFQRKNLVT
jgi:succinate dehydrogenase / fumarate reductase flavoprotein subunit